MSRASFASTPAFAPAPSRSFAATSLPPSSPISTQSLVSLPSQEAGVTPAARRRTSPHSSSSSVASTGSSSSPSSSASSANLMMSNVCAEEIDQRHPSDGKRLGRRSAQGSVGSLATTVSPGTDAIEEAVTGRAGGNKETQGGHEDGEDARMRERSSRSPGSTGTPSSTAGVSREGDSINLSALSLRREGERATSGALEIGGRENRVAEDPNVDGGAENGTASFNRTSATVEPWLANGAKQLVGGLSGNREVARLQSPDNRAEARTAASPRNPRAHPPAVTDAESHPLLPAASELTTPNHVDIVSYPSADLLRLLASLLEQIAQANDARNVRSAGAIQSTSTPACPSSPARSTTPSGSAPSSLPSTRRNSLLNKSEDDSLARGRFDAAPLNSPVTPYHARRFAKIGGSGGPGILDNAFEQDDNAAEADADEEMPLTPGVDLLREVGHGGGVEGFMPSLGGTHQPMPLGRRRGSSFIRNKRAEETASRTATSRQSTASSSVNQPSSDSPSSFNNLSSADDRPASSTPRASSPISSPTHTTPPVATASFEPPLTALFSASSVALSSPNATLCFHARNVPAISIEAYLLRILKYCPTTNEVFLALLVYFDRMARIGLEAQRLGLPRDGPIAGQSAEGGGATSATHASKLFAIDSFNVHRLVIAGVTVASKFFSDVFYTNSRYAKVGGLPLHELNQLELQFLLLNDFRLKVSTDELQRYADQLILFWIGRNGTSNPPAAAAAKAAANALASSTPSAGPSHTLSAASFPPDDQRPMQTQLTRSAVAAHHQSSSTSSPAPSPAPHSSQAFSADLAHSVDPLDPRAPTASGVSISTSTSTSRSHALARPRSVRSQPSSSGTSVTSTITPGTPSTTRGRSSSESGSDGDDAGDVRVRARGRVTGRGGRTSRVEPCDDGHFHDGWSSNEASSRDSSAERDERDRRQVDQKLGDRDDRMQED
ncbi:hypothetical protein JCM16303_001436 [Sporobolomyces ruberrimus]